MTCAIVYSSRTGNTKRLAEAIEASLQPQGCLYVGPPDEAALAADRLYIGFWTDKGTCDTDVADFLSQVSGKEVSCSAPLALEASRHTLKASLTAWPNVWDRETR